jgi:pimeloyl-ACP methyl ester carboxylesterase
MLIRGRLSRRPEEKEVWPMFKIGACAALLMLVGCMAEEEAEFELDETTLISTLTRTTVCFTVHNGTDPVPARLTGTLYLGGQAFDASTPVIIAVHGAGGDRSVWDVGMSPSLSWATPLVQHSLAPKLAQAGYAVISYDRLGYGQSPYLTGTGYDITAENHLAMLREVVTQVKGGSYDLQTGDSCATTGSAPAFGSNTIVLTGHSYGGFMVSSYAGLYHDVAAIIPMGSSTSGFSNELFNNLFGPWVGPQLQQHDYFKFFPPGSSGVSDSCLRFHFYVEGADADVYNTVCDNDAIGVDPILLIPSGEIITLGQFALGDTRERIKTIGDIPVLLAYADHDRHFKGPEEATAGDPDVQTAELQYYQENCGCDVSLFTQQNSGHMFFWHRTANQTSSYVVDYVINWLSSNGITN